MKTKQLPSIWALKIISDLDKNSKKYGGNWFR